MIAASNPLQTLVCLALFAAVILTCGFTHFLDAISFELPVYRLSGLVKLLTALVSWVTVMGLVPEVPRIMAEFAPASD